MAKGTVVNNAAVVLNARTADELVIQGLTGITLPIGFTMQNVTIDVMGERLGTVVPTGGTYDVCTIPYNFLANDPSQAALMQGSLNSTEYSNARFYIDHKIEGDFCAPDRISDSTAVYTIGTISAPTATKNAILTGNIDFLPSGASALFNRHASGTDLSFAADTGTGATITDSGGTMNFVSTIGFAAGQTLIIDKLGSLDPLFAKIASVTETVITLESGVGDADQITTTTGASDTAVHAATPMVVSGI